MSMSPCGRKSISDESLVEMLVDVDAMSEDNATFVAACADELTKSGCLSNPSRDRLIRIGRACGLLKTEAAKRLPRIGSYKQSLIDGSGAYARLTEQAREALTRRPPMRRAG